MAIDATLKNLAGPFPTNDTLVCGTRYLMATDIGNAASVCKAWNEAMKYHGVWFELFQSEGIPLVDKLEESRYREAFQLLYPITLSGKTIAELFGRIDGKIPCLQLECYNQLLNDNDPWEPTKKMHETFRLEVDPHSIIRPYDKALFDRLSQDGDAPTLLPDKTTPTEMRIPFGLKNRRVLIKYVYDQHKNGPVIGPFSYEVLVQCNRLLKGVALHLMRKEVVYRSMSYADQKEQVEKKGFEVVSLGVRLLFDAAQIIKFGTCPDGQGSPYWTYARASDKIKLGENYYPVAIGGFAPGAGVDVDDSYGRADDDYGVLPGAPAEVLRPLVLG